MSSPRHGQQRPGEAPARGSMPSSARRPGRGHEPVEDRLDLVRGRVAGGDQVQAGRRAHALGGLVPSFARERLDVSGGRDLDALHVQLHAQRPARGSAQKRSSSSAAAPQPVVDVQRLDALRARAARARRAAGRPSRRRPRASPAPCGAGPPDERLARARGGLHSLDRAVRHISYFAPKGVVKRAVMRRHRPMDTASVHRERARRALFALAVLALLTAAALLSPRVESRPCRRGAGRVVPGELVVTFTPERHGVQRGARDRQDRRRGRAADRVDRRRRDLGRPGPDRPRHQAAAARAVRASTSSPTSSCGRPACRTTASFGEQWGLRNLGHFGGKAGADVGATVGLGHHDRRLGPGRGGGHRRVLQAPGPRAQRVGEPG